uniref:Acetyl-coenzyme A carboxylase carboxyl transferase subunit beta n=1 Tax=Ombrophytum subterraneum TaxID=50155 RepID=A0A8E7MLY7_9MAGN|nr:acetyl-CoA carboxylase carboxyltransferase beta subunit [Ombrophytum subterraneum]
MNIFYNYIIIKKMFNYKKIWYNYIILIYDIYMHINFKNKQNYNLKKNIYNNYYIVNKNEWIQCKNCYELNYKKFIKLKNNICEYCGYYFKINNLDRIEFLVDKNTWNNIDEYIINKFDSEEKKKVYHYQKKTGLMESIQIGIGKLKGINIALGIMDFTFIGGSMGSVVGEKISCLIEYSIYKFLPIIIICSSGGARMQEGSFSLMQMSKISSILYNFQLKKKLFYMSILTSPTTGGVTASFGMLGDIIISEPNSYISFAGKRVIEQTLNKIVPEYSQISEYLFSKGLFDMIIPRNILKNVLNELLKLHNCI